MDKRLTSTGEIATYLDLTADNVNELVGSGKIPFVALGDFVRFDISKIDVWILECSVPVKKAKPEEEIKVDLGIKKKQRVNGGEGIGEPLICSKCEKPKQPDEFYVDKRTKRGRQVWCKQCMGTRSKELGEERKQAKLKKAAEKVEKRVEKKEEKEEKVPWAIGGKCRIENAEGKVIFENGKATCEEGEEWLRKKRLREEKENE